jgi:hypothetical protein
MDNPYKLEDFYPEGFGKKTLKKVRRAVELGGAYMDGRSPDWLDVVELDRLDLDTVNDDIMGQVLGPNVYSQEMKRRGMRWIVRHGFLDERIELLTQAWREYIYDRRAYEALRVTVTREEGDD